MSESKPKFKTERTRFFRSQPLDEQDERTVRHVEEFGCSIVHLADGPKKLNWSYTVGVFDTCGHPEIIAVGLLEDTAHHLLNEAASTARRGIDLSQGRFREMVGNVECEFRPVEKKWIRHLMGWAYWYNGSDEFPVLQAVYPDRANRFPEDCGFDEYFSQPLLQPGREWTMLEEDLWASADPKSSLADWKFADSPHTRVFLSEAVYRGREPITYVSHEEEDGAWQFLGDSMAGDGKPVVMCFHHPVDGDSSLKELVDLPLGWYAVRENKDATWVRHKHEPEDEPDS